MSRCGSEKPPAGLGKAGRALWKSITDDLGKGWELDSRETHFLTGACRCADELAALEKAVDEDGASVPGSRGQVTVHPAMGEARQLRLVQLRLLGALELADPEETKARRAPGHWSYEAS